MNKTIEFIKTKYLSIIIIVIMLSLTIVLSSSYGLFRKIDNLTDINFVAGNLNYSITSSRLTNNKIEVYANEEIKLTLTLTSLNNMDSKYEMYYLVDGEKDIVECLNVTYSTNSKDSVSGKIDKNASKEITVSIINDTDKSYVIEFGCEGGLISNELDMNKGLAISPTSVEDDVSLAYVYTGDGDAPTKFPEKGDGYYIKSLTCTGGTAVWDYETWGMRVLTTTGDSISCEAEVEDIELLSTHIMDLASINTTELRIDTHTATGQQTFAATEYRYWGATPNNYVKFNNEMWRIIGVFDVDDGTGNVEQRVKIIRNESIGNYSWDSSDSGINYSQGINEWSQADLMTLLNKGAYYNRTTGTCYNDSKNSTTACDFTTTGLTSGAKSMMGDAKWYLGAHTTNAVTVSDMYRYERGTSSGKQCTNETYCNDGVTRTTSWVGQVGLMYPSDYGYAANMTSCSGTKLSSYSTSCYKTDWLKSTVNWVLNPYAHTTSASYVFSISSTGFINKDGAYGDYGVRPATYLISDIKIVGGTGESGNPYQISK